MLNHANNRGGRKSFLSAEQENMIAESLIFAARRGFAADLQDTKHLMGRIAALCGKPYKNGTPSNDTVRLFRAKHREITFRKHESKDKAKVSAETFDHVDPFFKIIDDIGKENVDLLNDGNRIWNFDETDVASEHGSRRKVFSDSSSHHGGTRSAHIASGNGRHVTSVIAVSASRKVCPPFFIVEGKNIMEDWLLPLSESLLEKCDSPLIRQLTKPGWFPNDAVICKSDSGSMNMDILRLFIKHLEKEVRKHVSEEKRFLLTLDGHASRKGVEWLDECVSISCEAVLAPANTSHFLQPCDQDVNKRFKKELRNIVDELNGMATFDHKTIQFKHMCGVIAHARIAPEDCASEFCKTGIFRFNRGFVERFIDITIDLTGDDATADVNQEKTSAQIARKIVLTEQDDSRMLQRLCTVLKNRETTNSILMSHAPVRSASSGSASTAASTNRAVMCSGAPTEYLTVGAAIAKKKKETGR